MSKQGVHVFTSSYLYPYYLGIEDLPKETIYFIYTKIHLI